MCGCRCKNDFLAELVNDHHPVSPPSQTTLHGLVLGNCVSVDSSWIQGHSEETRSAWDAMRLISLPETAEMDPGESQADTSPAQVGFGCLDEAGCSLLREAVALYLCYHLPAQMLNKSDASQSVRNPSCNALHMFLLHASRTGGLMCLLLMMRQGFNFSRGQGIHAFGRTMAVEDATRDIGDI